jgi:flavin reductase (DIM6/NTAB) family NADH-FMN oxidoreductase RutF
VTTALNPLEYRRVVGRFATGITVITTVTGDLHHAMTCNSFTSVSLDPVLVLFCAEKVARFHGAVLESGTWAVSVLSTGQQHISRHFAVRGRDLEGQFDELPHTLGPVTGAVVLDGALAALECRTVSVTDAGDHTVLIGQVLGLSVPEPTADPLLYYEGRYRTFQDCPD